MKYRILLILIYLCYSLQSRADGWVIIDTVGIVSIEIEADASDRNDKQLKKVARRIHRIAKKLNNQTKYGHVFNQISLHETGPNGFIALGPKFKRQGDSLQWNGLSINLPASLLTEETVLRLYEYAIFIKHQSDLSLETLEKLMSLEMLEQEGIIPPRS